MADLRIVDAPEIPTENITGEEKLPTGGSGNYSISLDSLADYTKTKKDLADNTTVDGKVNGVRQELDAHIEDLLNPHQVTKGQIGLDNVDNTADADKPVSNSTQAAIISAVAPKADKTYVDTALSSKVEKTYVDNQLTLKANKADVYTKSETYTKQESSALVNNSISTALTPVNSSLDLAKRGVANRYNPSLTYNLGERVVLTNSEIVRSTIDGNVNNPNVDMTGWAYSSLTPSNNLSDVLDKAEARTNLDVYSKAETVAIAATPDATETVAGKAKIATTAIAQEGANDTDIITALKLKQSFTSLHGDTGWEKLPDGLIIQWGLAAIDATTPFPIAFPTACYQVAVSHSSFSYNGMAFASQSITATRTGVTMDSDSGVPNSYIAIGR